MKILKRCFSFLLMLLFISAMTANAFADTKYMLRLYGGDSNVGSLTKDQNADKTELDHTDKVDFYVGTDYVTIKDNKYYAKGIRETGKDERNDGNNVQTSYIAAESTVNEGKIAGLSVSRDQDYVVVYGIKGIQVQFTIRCVDAATGALLRTLTYWGDPGDRPRITLPYIEGYNPPTQIGMTPSPLSTDSSQNIWNARYTRITTTTTTTTTTVTGGGGGGGGAVAGGAAANGNAANNPANNAANNPNANNQQDVNNPVNNTNTQPNTPADFGGYEDIIDAEVPLAVPNIPGVGTVTVPNAPQVIEPNQHGRIPNWMLIAGLVVLVGLISVLYWYLLFYRKKKKYASINDDYEILGFDNDDDF